MTSYEAILLGIDLSTTKTGIGVRAADGAQQYADIEMRGDTTWHDQPAFDLSHVQRMLLQVLRKLEIHGWHYRNSPGSLSLSVRQHDMVLLDANDELLIPALSWQCNVASEQVARLVEQGADKVVGKIEERFILPKLMWALEQDPSLKNKIRRVMTTGDYLVYKLTGTCRLSTSDALSNGLLDQSTKQVATAVLAAAGLDPSWLPEAIPSGHVIATVAPPAEDAKNDWAQIAGLLAGWQITAPLGDNHATGVGCGGLIDDRTIVVSAGTSGTINRRVRPSDKLRGNAACFEFYDDRLLLMMLADCGAWYERFYESYRQGKSHKKLSELAASADLGSLRRVVYQSDADNPAERQCYPHDWQTLSLAQQAASTQLSIMAELLKHVRAMLDEVVDGPPVTRFVLTGGLSQSPLFQQAYRAGIQTIAPNAEVLIGALSDELSHQTAAYGALINALLPERNGNLAAVCNELCPLKPCPTADAGKAAQLTAILRDWISE